jgi:hypothetical protein
VKVKIMEPHLPLKRPDEIEKPARIKKPYTTPKLVVYGNIEKITRAVGNTQLMLDSGPSLKTN